MRIRCVRYDFRWRKVVVLDNAVVCTRLEVFFCAQVGMGEEGVVL